MPDRIDHHLPGKLSGIAAAQIAESRNLFEKSIAQPDRLTNQECIVGILNDVVIYFKAATKKEAAKQNRNKAVRTYSHDTKIGAMTD
jgi:hypothetical protein